MVDDAESASDKDGQNSLVFADIFREDLANAASNRLCLLQDSLINSERKM
jgi:hypothetical protein